jgi:hypothetical protein
MPNCGQNKEKRTNIMERKYIDISGNNIKTGPWIHTRPAKNFKFIESNKVTFAITENNYYLDTKKDKVRYSFMNCDNASYDHLYHVYMQVYPGLFAFTRSATDNNLTNIMERYSKIYHDNDYSNNTAIEVWRKQLLRKK